MMLVFDTRSNMTPKYITQFSFIRCHYKSQNCEIDMTQCNASFMTPHLTFASSNNLVILPYLVHIPFVALPFIQGDSSCMAALLGTKFELL